MRSDHLLVLIGGGRAWPNFWSVLTYEPTQVHLVVPETERAGIQHTVRWLERRGVRVEGPSFVPPYDAEAARRSAAQILAEHPQRKVVFNVTGGPKPIAAGVCRAIWDAGRQDVCAVYIDTREGRAHPLLTPEAPALRAFKPRLADYLSACGRKLAFEKELQDLPATQRELMDLARTLATADYRDLIIRLRGERNKRAAEAHRQEKQQGDTHSARAHDPLTTQIGQVSEGQKAHLDRIAKCGLLSWDCQGEEVTVRFYSPKAARFLEGPWLDLYAREAARKCVDGDGTLVFADCQCYVKIETAELDLACLDRNGIMLYASCKTDEDPFKNRRGRHGVDNGGRAVDYLNEVVKNATLLGGAFCARVLITNAPRAQCRDAVRKQARERRLALVCLEDLPELGKHLARALDETRKHAR
jgi:hypothetical protein